MLNPCDRKDQKYIFFWPKMIDEFGAQSAKSKCQLLNASVYPEN